MCAKVSHSLIESGNLVTQGKNKRYQCLGILRLCVVLRPCAVILHDP